MITSRRLFSFRYSYMEKENLMVEVLCLKELSNQVIINENEL